MHDDQFHIALYEMAPDSKLRSQQSLSLAVLNRRPMVTRNSDSPTVVSLFCGCGGFDVGFDNAGFRGIGAFEYLSSRSHGCFEGTCTTIAVLLI